MRVGRDVPKDDPKHGTFLYGSNQWPDLPERDFKEPVMEYREHMLRLATDIMVILSKGLQYGDDAFDEYLQDPVASVKLLHYPPQPVDGGNEIGGKFSPSLLLFLHITTIDVLFYIMLCCAV